MSGARPASPEDGTGAQAARHAREAQSAALKWLGSEPGRIAVRAGRGRLDDEVLLALAIARARTDSGARHQLGDVAAELGIDLEGDLDR